MRGAGEATVIDEWKRLADLEPGPRVRLDNAVDAQVFAELTGAWNEWKQALEGWNVRTSQQVREWQAEGALANLRANLLLLLEERFQAPMPRDIASLVQGTQDMNTLLRWFKTAIKANSLDEFRAAIHTPG